MASDAEVSARQTIAQFAYKPDGGSMWGDFVVSLPAAQAERVFGVVLSTADRTALQGALDRERAAGYYFETQLDGLLAAQRAAAAAGTPVPIGTTSTQGYYDTARAKAVAAVSVTPRAGPVLVNQQSGSTVAVNTTTTPALVQGGTLAAVLYDTVDRATSPVSATAVRGTPAYALPAPLLNANVTPNLPPVPAAEPVPAWAWALLAFALFGLIP